MQQMMWLFCDDMFEESSFLEDMQILDFAFWFVLTFEVCPRFKSYLLH